MTSLLTGGRLISGLQDQKQKTDRTLGVCRTITAAFSHSWHRRRELKKKQVGSGLPQHSLIADCATRWGSKQAMIERILEQAQAIRQVLADERRSGISLTWQDTDVLQAINAALKPVSAFTDILSGENCVSGSSVLPILKLCSEDILAASDDDVPLTKAIKAGIMGKLEAKYKNDDVRNLLRKSTFLDARYRGRYETDDASLAEIKT
ncbi:hypothetical protein NFI96_005209 [Prochilodus magdalenae]|nr:hypothetical protein NFI96_005209 [Prochilodus magdalenae]